jgi:hypothetical protein
MVKIWASVDEARDGTTTNLLFGAWVINLSNNFYDLESLLEGKKWV